MKGSWRESPQHESDFKGQYLYDHFLQKCLIMHFFFFSFSFLHTRNLFYLKLKTIDLYATKQLGEKICFFFFRERGFRKPQLSVACLGDIGWGHNEPRQQYVTRNQTSRDYEKVNIINEFLNYHYTPITLLPSPPFHPSFNSQHEGISTI